MTKTHASHPFELSPTLSRPGMSALIFLVIAVAFGVAALGHFYRYFELPPELSSIPFEPICGGFAFVSFVFGIRAFLRRQVYRVDPLKQNIQKISAGILGSRYGDVIPFNQIDHIQVVREVHGTTNNKTTDYRVYIHGKGVDPRRVYVSRSYEPARVWGERLAAATNLNLHDDSQPGGSQIRKPEELDETVGEKFSKAFSHRAQPSAPTILHAQLQPGLNQLTIEIPPFDLNRLGPMKKVVWVLLAIFGGGATAAFYLDLDPLFLFAAFVFLVMIYVLARSETVTLTRESLSVGAGIFFLKRTKKIPLSELEELYLSNATREESAETDQLLESGEVSGETHTALEAIVALGSSIIARSDRESITFGRILSQDELDFILYELEQRIRG